MRSFFISVFVVSITIFVGACSDDSAEFMQSEQTATPWTMKNEIDSMTDEVIMVAYVINKQGYMLKIFYPDKKSTSVHATFVLPENLPDEIDSEHLIAYRIDNNSYIDLSARKDFTFTWNPKWITYSFGYAWEGDVSYNLRQLMTGNKILLRYYLNTGGYKETLFDLKDAKNAVTAALEINYDPNEKDLARIPIDEKQALYLYRCRIDNDRNECMDRLYKCYGKAIEGLDVSILDNCYN